MARTSFSTAARPRKPEPPTKDPGPPTRRLQTARPTIPAHLPPELRREVDAVLESLTLEEQVSLLSGSDFWRTTEIPGKVPSIKTTDGPAGARGEHFSSGTRAALFPSAVSLAATWDTPLVQRVGAAIAQEAHTKGASVLLGPTACCHRSPLGGRNFESFSEDPLLSGKLAAAWIRGAQGEGVGVAMKHFVANEQETRRFTIDEIVAERSLREIYMKPFEIAVREAGPWAIMTAYNKLNGEHADSNHFTLQEVLRNQWGYDGLVMSDWGGTNSTVDAVKAGLDLEMPGPARQRGQKLLDAVRSNADPELLDAIKTASRHVLELVARVGKWKQFTETPESAVDRPEHRQLIREAGCDGIVLLRNEPVVLKDEDYTGAWSDAKHLPVLPLTPDVKSIAWIGPNANASMVTGGGSATLNPHYVTNPLDAIREAVGKDVNVEYEIGCQTEKWVKLFPVDSGRCCTSPDGQGQPGLRLEFFPGRSCEGQPTVTRTVNSSDIFLPDGPPAPISDSSEYSIRLTAWLRADEDGKHVVGLGSIGPAKLYIDDELLIDHTSWTSSGELFFGAGSSEVRSYVDAVAGTWYKFVAETTTKSPDQNASNINPHANQNIDLFSKVGIRLGCDVVQDQRKLIARAAELASKADVAIVLVGNNDDWESEGYDRDSMALPGLQNDLIAAVAAANRRTAVVLQAGCAVEMPWLPKVPAVLYAWYQGQEAGNVLADVILGKADPGGRLPISLPGRIYDTPSYGHFGEPDVRRKNEVHYSEGVYVGYRYYDTHRIPVLFPFGFGLSYTQFTVGRVSSSNDTLRPGDKIVFKVPVKNVGSRKGKTVLQLYLHQKRAPLNRPRRELKDWAKIELEPGQETEVTLELGERDPGFWDEDAGCWRVVRGVYEAIVAGSCSQVKGRADVRVDEEWEWVF